MSKTAGAAQPVVTHATGGETPQERAEPDPEPQAEPAADAKETARKPESSESYHHPASDRKRQLVESRSHTLAVEQLPSDSARER